MREDHDGMNSQGGMNLLKEMVCNTKFYSRDLRSNHRGGKLYIVRFLETSKSTVKIGCTLSLMLAETFE